MLMMPSLAEVSNSVNSSLREAALFSPDNGRVPYTSIRCGAVPAQWRHRCRTIVAGAGTALQRTGLGFQQMTLRRVLAGEKQKQGGTN